MSLLRSLMLVIIGLAFDTLVMMLCMDYPMINKNFIGICEMQANPEMGLTD